MGENMQISALRSQNQPRFYNRGNEFIYALFNAFIEATLIKNRAVDFDISPSIASENHCEFDTLQKKFVDLLNLSDLPNLYKSSISLLSQDDTISYLTNKKNNGQNVDDCNLLFAHLHWLWSLGITIQTTCGVYANSKINESAAFAKGGLWSADNAMVRKPNDFKFMIDVFQAYFLQQMRPMNIEQAKKELEKIVLNAYPCNPTPMANALLHYCDPNKHIHIFASEIKKRIIIDAPSITKGTYNSIIDVNNASIDEIDNEICNIYDSIVKIDSYDAIMRKYFYKYST